MSSWCHCHPVISCFVKIQIGLTFPVPAYQGCLGKEAVKRVSVCYLLLLGARCKCDDWAVVQTDTNWRSACLTSHDSYKVKDIAVRRIYASGKSSQLAKGDWVEMGDHQVGNWQVNRQHSSLITCRERRTRGETYIGHGRLCVCVSVCLCPSPHSHTATRTRM